MLISLKTSELFLLGLLCFPFVRTFGDWYKVCFFGQLVGACLTTDLFIAELAMDKISDIFEVIVLSCSIMEARLFDFKREKSKMNF